MSAAARAAEVSPFLPLPPLPLSAYVLVGRGDREVTKPPGAQRAILQTERETGQRARAAESADGERELE